MQPTSQDKGPERSVVLAVRFDGDDGFEDRVSETKALAAAAGYEVVDTVYARRRRPDSRAFVGKGKIEETAAALTSGRAGTLLLTHTLSDGQHSRLSSGTRSTLIDHSGLILTIFAKRATTSEGKLQVELAQEIYGKAKLKGTWTHLERQRGSLGATGGPGERQLELDRRLAARKINNLRKRLAKRRSHIDLSSKRRRSGPFTVALVGYTNAGKSSLFMRLTKSKVPSSSRLFETLTTTSRKLHLGDGRQVVLSDTVGFVRDLPHELVEAFQTTLKEAVISDLLLVTVDAGDSCLPAKLAVIDETLARVGARDIPRMLLLNKSDTVPFAPNGFSSPWDKIPSLAISALTCDGVPQLMSAIGGHLASAQAMKAGERTRTQGFQ